MQCSLKKVKLKNTSYLEGEMKYIHICLKEQQQNKTRMHERLMVEIDLMRVGRNKVEEIDGMRNEDSDPSGILFSDFGTMLMFHIPSI